MKRPGVAAEPRWWQATRVVATILSQDDPDCFDEALHLLREGQLVCYPTDTVYGLGADAANEDAVRRLFAVKGRPTSKAMPLLIADAVDANHFADVTPVARTLAQRFWPGGLTIVMRKSPGFRSFALAGQDTVALRVPDHDAPRTLVRALGGPIIGTSANRAGGAAADIGVGGGVRAGRDGAVGDRRRAVGGRAGVDSD